MNFLQGKLKTITPSDRPTLASVKNAVWSGGGAKGTAYCNVLKYLEQNNVKLQNVAGASAGAITAYLIALGYTAAEVAKILAEKNLGDFLDSKVDLQAVIADPKTLLNPLHVLWTGYLIRDIVSDYGIANGRAIKKWFKDLAVGKGFSPDVTFKQLYDKTGIGLFVINCNLSRGVYAIRSWQHSPDLSVVLAIRTSMSIPLAFDPEIINGEYWVDGGTTLNYPIGLFDDLGFAPNETVGFMTSKKEDVTNPQPKEIKNVVGYLGALYSTFSNTSYDAMIKAGNTNRTIFIDPMGVGTLEFKIPANKLTDILVSATKACEAFFK